MHVHLDPIGGLAGDMFLGAVLHGWPELVDEVTTAMRTAGLPPAWSVSVEPGTSAGIAGMRVRIRGDSGDHHHATGTFREIRRRLEEAGLADGVRRRAIDIFRILAEAEAVIHGVLPEEVHFHEIADWDSIADIVGAAAAIEALDAVSWSVGDLPMGSGTVMTAHGRMPVPAPAAALLLRGYRLDDDGVAGERITPTGAALLRHLEARQDERRPAGVVTRVGHGLGTRALDRLANMVRIIALDAGTPDTGSAGKVGVVSFEVDDQSPEDLAVGLDRLRATAGVLDVVQGPVSGKKGRIALSIRVLCRVDLITPVIDACFAQTTTIGVRWRTEARVELERTERMISGHGAKQVRRPTGILTTKADLEAVAATTGDQAGRARLRRLIEGHDDDRER